jgi:hypothetical protein
VPIAERPAGGKLFAQLKKGDVVIAIGRPFPTTHPDPQTTSECCVFPLNELRCFHNFSNLVPRRGVGRARSTVQSEVSAAEVAEAVTHVGHDLSGY